MGGEVTHQGIRVNELGHAIPVTRTERVVAEARVSTSADLSIQSHDYDGWCENGTVCHRAVSSYISETKGNAAYGDRTGVIGTFDVVIRTNLNGRQPQWRVYWYHDSGPALSFQSTYLNCRKDINNLPDTNCGNWGVDNGDGSFYLGTGNIATPPVIYGNRLVDSDEYYAHVNGLFTPRGYPRYTMGTLRTRNFNCYGRDNCYFP